MSDFSNKDIYNSLLGTNRIPSSIDFSFPRSTWDSSNTTTFYFVIFYLESLHFKY
jgi:hypothetical protein